MGAAAYYRGNKAIHDGIYGPDLSVKPKPAPRPPMWGQKTAERALDRARRLVKGAYRYGRPPLHVEQLSELVRDLARCRIEVAHRAAQVAIAEHWRDLR